MDPDCTEASVATAPEIELADRWSAVHPGEPHVEPPGTEEFTRITSAESKSRRGW